MIYTDGTHVASDTSLEELHEFAVSKLGFPRKYFQNHPRHPHYDIMSAKSRKKALDGGAILLSQRAMMEKMCACGIWIPLSKENR